MSLTSGNSPGRSSFPKNMAAASIAAAFLMASAILFVAPGCSIVYGGFGHFWPSDRNDLTGRWKYYGSLQMVVSGLGRNLADKNRKRINISLSTSEKVLIRDSFELKAALVDASYQIEEKTGKITVSIYEVDGRLGEDSHSGRLLQKRHYQRNDDLPIFHLVSVEDSLDEVQKMPNQSQKPTPMIVITAAERGL